MKVTRKKESENDEKGQRVSWARRRDPPRRTGFDARTDGTVSNLRIPALCPPFLLNEL